MNRPVYLAFATGPQGATTEFLNRVAESNPDCTLLVVARQRPSQLPDGAEVVAFPAMLGQAIAGRSIRGAAIHATRQGGEWNMRWTALRLAGRDLRLYNDNLDHFRIGDFPTLWSHLK